MLLAPARDGGPATQTTRFWKGCCAEGLEQVCGKWVEGKSLTWGPGAASCFQPGAPGVAQHEPDAISQHLVKSPRGCCVPGKRKGMMLVCSSQQGMVLKPAELGLCSTASWRDSEKEARSENLGLGSQKAPLLLATSVPVSDSHTIEAERTTRDGWVNRRWQMDTVTGERERWVGKGHSWESWGSAEGRSDGGVLFCLGGSWTKGCFLLLFLLEPPCFPGRCILASPPHTGGFCPTHVLSCVPKVAHPPERLMLWYCTNLPHGAKNPPKPPVMNFRSSLSCY